MRQINIPDHSFILHSINGHLYNISKNTKKMGYSLESIEKDIKRVADSSEVAAGIVSKEEIQIEKAIERINKKDLIMNGTFFSEEAPDDVREEYKANAEKIEQLRQLQQRIKDEREHNLLELRGEEELKEYEPLKAKVLGMNYELEEK